MNKSRFAQKWVGVCLVVVGALAAGSCDDTSATSDDIPATGPLHVVSSSVFTPDAATTFLRIAPSLEAGFDQAPAIEVPGVPFLMAPPQPDGRFYVALQEEPTIERYEIEDGAVVRTGRVSLAGVGVGSFTSFSHAIVSPTKAYYFGLDEERVVVWDPESMTVTGELAVNIPFDDPEMAGLIPYAQLPLVHDGLAIVPFALYDGSVERVGQQSGVVLIDIETDTVVVDVDSRCASIGTATVAADGHVYFGSTPFGATTAATSQPELVSDCALRRLSPDGSGLDDEFVADLRGLDETAPTGGLLAGARDFYVKVFDETLASAPLTSSIDYAVSAWRWWRIDLASMTGAPVAAMPPSSAGYRYHTVDGRTFVDEYDEESQRSVMWSVSEPDGPSPIVRVLGFVYGMARVR